MGRDSSDVEFARWEQAQIARGIAIYPKTMQQGTREKSAQRKGTDEEDICIVEETRQGRQRTFVSDRLDSVEPLNVTLVKMRIRANKHEETIIQHEREFANLEGRLEEIDAEMRQLDERWPALERQFNQYREELLAQ